MLRSLGLAYEFKNTLKPTLPILYTYASVKVNWGAQDYDRGMFDRTGDSDNSSSFRYHSDIILTLQMVEI